MNLLPSGIGTKRTCERAGLCLVLRGINGHSQDAAQCRLLRPEADMGCCLVHTDGNALHGDLRLVTGR